MYILDTLYYIYKPIKREDLILVSKTVSKKYRVSQIKVIIDMIICSLKYGSMWTEYGDLDFYDRTADNKASYITTFFNFKLYDAINEKEFREVFHEKILFLEKFKNFINRAWISTDTLSDEKIKTFLRIYPNIVAKTSHGDSGKEVEVINITPNDDLDMILEYIKSKKFNLIEEQIFNCDELMKLNPTSLNTLRIVTVKTGETVNILFTGIRVGGIGSKIDNISQGGRVARINRETGVIESHFYAKSSSYSVEDINDRATAIGIQIPRWTEVIEIVKKAALIVPQIGIVAWDVAIGAGGIEVVEGNESFGSVIMQLYYNQNEEGLKPLLLKILEDR